jgi:hypothetical protein
VKILADGWPLYAKCTYLELEMTEDELNSLKNVLTDYSERMKGYGVYRVTLDVGLSITIKKADSEKTTLPNH